MAGNVRRIAVLAIFAVVLLGLPVLPASSGRTPSVNVRDHQVRQWHDDAGWRVSAPVRVDDVAVVGATWSGAGELEWRLRETVGAGWGGWEHFDRPDEAEESPDPGSAEGRRANNDASLPVPVSGAHAIQVRTRGATTVSLEMIEVDDNGYRPASMRANAASASAVHPDIMSRGEWDPGDECSPRDTPRYAADVRFGVVHHTAGSNNYSEADAWKQVLGVCKYHRNTLGWDDIGYNVLVDKYGGIYEGRAGGLENAVVGAHTAGFNGGSVGVSVLGCFGGCGGNDIPPPEVAKDALVDVMAWKFDLHHIDPNGTTTEISGGGGTTNIPRGEVVTLPTIIGHRDVANKACPGDFHDFVHGDMPERVQQAMSPALYGGPRVHEEQSVIGSRPHWDVTVDPAGPWELAIEDEDGEVVRSATGTGGSLDLRWDMRDSEGDEVAPGTYRATLSMPDLDATPIRTVFDVVPATERRFGKERIETSVELSRWAFDDAVLDGQGYPQTDAVIIASQDAYPDALVATTLAGVYDAPILLSNRDRLTPRVADEIARLGADEAYVIGGTLRLSEQVESDLRAAGVSTVERLAGPTRYHTAGKVAWRVIQEEGPKEILLALGQHPDEARGYQDALIGGAFGGTFELPILLVQPDNLTEPSEWVLEQRSWPEGVTLIGGKETVTAGVKSAAKSAAGGARLREIAGENHYGTARLVADELLARWDEGPDDPNSDSDGLEVVLATGENWPDALGAGAAAVARGAAFVLVHDRDIGNSEPVREWLVGHAPSLVHAVVAGGAMAVSDAVLGNVEQTIRSEGPNTEPAETWGS